MINRYAWIICSLTLTRSIYLNPKGPTHERYAVQCMKEIAAKNFYFLADSDKQILDYDGILLLTIMTTFSMTSPAYEIQLSLIKELNIMLNWTIETVDDGNDQLTFGAKMEQCTDCKDTNNDQDEKRFVPVVETNFYIMVVDSKGSINAKLETLKKLQSYNSMGQFLIYYAAKGKEYHSDANLILDTLRQNLIFNALVLVPKTLAIFVLYTLDFHTAPSQLCTGNGKLTVVEECKEGVIDVNKRYYENKLGSKFDDCIINVVANKIEPYVISASEGLEIEIIQELGSILQINFNISLLDDKTWGVKQGDEWTGGLDHVFSGSCLGVGNIAPLPEYTTDFDFTETYWRDDLQWIVPIAQIVPAWRILTVIFDWKLWLVCLGLIVLTAVLLSITSVRSKNEEAYFKPLSNDIFVALQLLITSVVFQQPKSDLTRLVFVTVAILSIIISSVYTSSLIKYLTTPHREHQISSVEDILASDLKIGGFDIYYNIFNVSNDEQSMEIFEKFEVYEEQGANGSDWLRGVAEDRTSCTIYSKFAILYMISQDDAVLTDPRGRATVFIVKKKILSYSLSIVLKDGDPMLVKLNYVIGYMVTGGLVLRISQKYSDALEKEIAAQQEEDEAQNLSVDHLQGAFAILIFGYVSGTVALLVENVTKLIKTKSNK